MKQFAFIVITYFLSVQAFAQNTLSKALTERNSIYTQNYPKYRVAFDFGYGRLLAPPASDLDSEIQKYFKKLNSGFSFSSEMHYYISEPIGFGLCYSSFRTKNTLYNVYRIDESGEKVTGRLSDKIRLRFIGPSVSVRLFDYGKENAVLANIALGYLAYHNDNEEIESYTLTGGTVGAQFGLGYDFRLGDGFALGLQASFVSGVLTSLMVDDGTTKEKVDFPKGTGESLYRFNLTAGLRFMK